MSLVASSSANSGVDDFPQAPPPVSPSELEAYRRDGYLVLREFFDPALIQQVSDEAEALLTERRDLIDTNNLRCRFQPHHENGDCLFETFDPINDLSPACDRVARDRRLLEVLEAIYGEPAVLFKDKLIFKPPGAKGYGIHQDYIAWENFPRSFLTVLVPIDSCNPENGSTELYAGLHHDGPLTPTDGNYRELSVEQLQGAQPLKLTLAPGDIAIFGGFTPHGSSPNRSPVWRRQLYLSYNAISDGGDQRAEHYAYFQAWLKERYAEYGKPDTYFR
ncbi:MAG: hypothetical protein C0478_02735 [Planctomyces sp.]|nr:hypothetical protein [Planctomyces sp.]